MTLDIELTWSTHTNQIEEKVVQRLFVLRRFLGSILLAVWTAHPCLEARCPHSYQEAAGVTKCLRFATNAHSHVCNKQIHEDFGCSIFSSKHHRTDREVWLKICSYGGHSTCAASELTKVAWVPGRKRLEISRPADALCTYGSVDRMSCA